MDLVIGIGNTLRQDDGLGPHVVATLSSSPGVKTLSVHQLGPELAGDLAEAERVLFVDAHRNARDLALSPVKESPVPTGHALSPGGLLELTRALYGRAPLAFLLTAPGTAFGFGEALSSQATAVAPRVVKAIRDWIEDRPAIPSRRPQAAQTRRHV